VSQVVLRASAGGIRLVGDPGSCTNRVLQVRCRNGSEAGGIDE